MNQDTSTTSEQEVLRFRLDGLRHCLTTLEAEANGNGDANKMYEILEHLDEKVRQAAIDCADLFLAQSVQRHDKLSTYLESVSNEDLIKNFLRCKEMADEARTLACAYEGVNPSELWVGFNKDNPYIGKMKIATQMLINHAKLLKERTNLVGL